MRLVYIASSLILFNCAYAATSFTSWALKLSSDNEESIIAREELLKIENLDEQLKNAIETEGQTQMLALQTISSLHRISLIPKLMEKVKTTDVKSKQNSLLVTTLASMGEGQEGSKILEFLNQTIDLNSQDIPLTTRMAVLSTWQLQEKSPDPEKINSLLADKDSQIRLKAMETLESYYRGDKSKLVPLIKNALSLSPFPLRMRAANLAQELAPADKLKLSAELKKCQNDPQEEVRSACKMAIEQK
ncbi:MAG: hypothetical protein K2P81_14300 [Bacteriovoracaceae bacterium]|nr:hypothetical protein [Bacteriovoracaceae bacterium]